MNKIQIRWPWSIEAHERIDGPAVILDVNAASTNIAAILGSADEFYVTNRDGLHTVLEKMPDAILVGESKDPEIAKKFQVSNNASHIDQAVRDGIFTGRRIVLLTTNGTYVLCRLIEHGATPVLSVSYVNLFTVSSWLASNGYDSGIMLVPAGGQEIEFENDRELVEDKICAEALAAVLRGEQMNREVFFAASRAGIDRQYVKYEGLWPTKQADLDLIFSPRDRYPVVPLCRKTTDGLIRVIDALTTKQ